MNIANLFISAANQYPNKVAIIEKGNSITYSQLLLEVKQTAAYFSEKGIKQGDRVLVFVPMSIDLYRIVLALFYIGATAVFLDEWVNMKRLALCCQLAECTGFIGGFKARVLGLLSKEIRKIPIKLNTTKKACHPIQITNVNPENAALITFTTGSTGTPKAANRTHNFLNEQFNALLHEINPKVSDIDMVVLPIVLFVNLGVGCTSVIADFKMTKPNKMKAVLIANQIGIHKVNRITASPFFIKKMAQFAISTKTPFSEIEKVFTGGAPVFPNEALLYTKAFQNATCTIVYGSTESEPISSIVATDLITRKNELTKGLPVGKPDQNIQLKIIKITEIDIPNCTVTELNQMELPKGEIGEIIVAGPHVLKQYFKNETAFQANKIIVDGEIWHRTGDSGKILNNELYLNGRCAQLIKRNNQFVSPFISEYQLQLLDGITMGTILEIERKLIVIVESVKKKEEILTQLHPFNFDELKVLKSIPRDPRHNSKIDYNLLLKKVT